MGKYVICLSDSGRKTGEFNGEIYQYNLRPFGIMSLMFYYK